jgi:hypothetical protein
MAWTANGPVSVPPRGLVYVVAFLILAAAAGGSVLGFKSSQRDTARGGATVGVDQSQGIDQAPDATPIVDITAMQAPPPTAAATNTLAAATNATAARTDEDAATNDIAVRAAAVQAAQNNPAKPAPDIDSILTSQTERPQPPAKPSTDDQPPNPPPAKTDVPF